MSRPDCRYNDLTLDCKQSSFIEKMWIRESYARTRARDGAQHIPVCVLTGVGISHYIP